MNRVGIKSWLGAVIIASTAVAVTACHEPEPTGVVGTDVLVDTVGDLTVDAGGDTVPDVTEDVAPEVSQEVVQEVQAETVEDVAQEVDVADTGDAADSDGEVVVPCDPDQCDIDGECWDNEAPNPDNACEVCSVIVDTLTWSPNDAGTCDDGTACTSNDRCQDGVCLGDATVCSDGNDCTDDSCDDATGECVYANNTAPCVSATPCNAAICDAGACVQTSDIKDCDDGNVCTDDSCDDALGCVNAANSATCDDGNACTTGDTCAAGNCAGTATDCDDGDICTVDSCSPTDGNCVHNDLSSQCTDDNPCTDESCDPTQGCVFPFNTDPCDDNNACTAIDTCDDGACNGTAIPLDDSNPCTTDSCDPITGPFSTPNALPCDDNDVCTIGDICANSACTAGTSTLACDDNEDCTDDSCDASTGCVNANNTAACDDGTVCTENDICGNGSCGGDAINCDDNNDCTTDSCDPTGGCANTLVVSNACRPVITVTYPPRGATITGAFANPEVNVTGNVVSGAGPITTFTINGDTVAVGNDGSFSYPMATAIGGNILNVEATDSYASANERVQSFLWSDTFREPNAPKTGITPSGMGIWLSQNALDDGDHSLPADDLATIFELVLSSFDLSSFIPNPVAAGVGGVPLSNATYTIFLNNISAPGAEVTLTAIGGGLRMSVVMTGPNGNGITGNILADKDCTWSLFGNPGCIGPGSITGLLTIDSITINTNIMLSVDANNEVVVTPQATSVVIGDAVVSNLSFDIFGLITNVVNDLVDDLIGDLGASFGTQIDTVIGPLLGDALGALAFNTSFALPALDGSGTDIVVDLVSDFDAINFDPAGGQFNLRASGYSAAGKVTPHNNDGIPGRRMCGAGAQLMSLPNASPLEVGLSDNVLNSILYAAWDGGLLEFPVPASLLGGVDLGQFGITNLNMVMSGMLAPTAMDCGPSGELIATIGDLGIAATMDLFGNPLTLQIWVSLTAGIELTAADGGIGIALTDIKSVFTEVNVAEDAGVAAEATIKGLIETELVGGLLGALGGDALGSIPLPTIDLSTSVPSLPPGTGFSILINGVNRAGGNTIVDGDLAGN